MDDNDGTEEEYFTKRSSFGTDPSSEEFMGKERMAVLLSYNEQLFFDKNNWKRAHELFSIYKAKNLNYLASRSSDDIQKKLLRADKVAFGVHDSCSSEIPARHGIKLANTKLRLAKYRVILRDHNDIIGTEIRRMLNAGNIVPAASLQ